MRSQMKRWVFVLALVFVMLFLAACGEQELDVVDEVDPFELENFTGDAYDSDNGKVKLVSFVLVNCPDGTCPMTMADLSIIQDELKEEGLFGDQIELLTVTIDPERDDLETLTSYAESFHVDPEGWKVLRGSVEQTEELAQDFRYPFDIDEEGNAIHPTTMYIVDEQHQVRAYHSMTTAQEEMDIDQIVADLQSLL